MKTGSGVVEEDLNLFDVLRMLGRRWRLITGFLLGGLLVSLLFIALVTPKYTSETVLKFNPTGFTINGEKATVASEMLDRLIAGELAAIQSPAVLQKVIESEKLVNDPELNRVGFARGLLRAIASLGQKDTGPKDHMQQLLEAMRKKVEVTNPDRTNLITVAYESESPEKAARVAGAIATTFLARHLETQLSDTPFAAKWLSGRSETLRRRWRESEDRVEKFRAENDLSYVGDEELREKQVNRINEQLVLAGTKTEEARARVEQARRLLKTANYEQLATVVKSDVLTRLRDRLAAATQRVAALGIELLPNHPQLRQASAEVASLKREIDDEGKRLLENLEIGFRTARDREQLIRGNFNKTIQGMQESGSALVKLRELERTAATDRAIYEAFLNRSNETQEQKTGELANFQLVKTARIPVKPSFPLALRVLLAGIAGSIIAGVGLALLLETHRQPPRGPAARRASAPGAPVLASLRRIPLLDFGPGAENRAQLRVPEEIVSLNAALGGSNQESRDQLVAVTSTAIGETKTALAAELARAAAQDGLKTLLIDGDWNRPRLHRLFGARGIRRNGSEGSSSPVLHDRASGMDILPVLKCGRSGAGFAATPEFAEMLRSARLNYDRIVVDCAGVPEDGATSVFVPEADRVLLIVPSGSLNAAGMEQAIEELKRHGARQIGLVFATAMATETAPAAERSRAAAREHSLPETQPFPAE